MINQLQCNPLMQQEGILPILDEVGCKVMAWGPLGGEGNSDIVSNTLLSAIGEKYGKSAAQVALRWLTQRGIVAIPKSVHPDRMQQNFEIFDFALTEEEMQQIANLNRHDAGAVNFETPEHLKYLIEKYG